MPWGLRGCTRTWTPQGTWLARAAPSPFPLRPKREREAPEEDNINNIPVAVLHKERVERLFHLHLSTLLKGAAAAVAAILARIATP